MNKVKELLQKIPFKLNPYILISILIVVVIVFSLTGRRSQEDTFNSFLDAYLADDAERIVELMPKEYIASLINSEGITSKEELEIGIQYKLDYDLQEYDDEELKTFDYEIAWVAKTSKGDSNIDIINIKSTFGDKAKKLKDICLIQYDPVIQAKWVDGGIYDKYLPRREVILVKIGQSWYVTEFDDLLNWI